MPDVRKEAKRFLTGGKKFEHERLLKVGFALPADARGGLAARALQCIAMRNPSQLVHDNCTKKSLGRHFVA
jgi:hypothetical protein